MNWILLCACAPITKVPGKIVNIMNYGIFLEVFILGELGSGVFSFGDLEANFQVTLSG